MRSVAALVLLTCSFGCAHASRVQKLDVDTYRITCPEASLDRCLGEAANNICDKRAYFVARGISDQNRRGRTDAPDVALSSEAIIRCAPSYGWGDQAKELMAGAATPTQPGTPLSAPSPARALETPAPICAPGSTQACVGAGACQGGQACKSDGSGYEPCDCGPAPATPAPPATSAEGEHP